MIVPMTNEMFLYWKMSMNPEYFGFMFDGYYDHSVEVILAVFSEHSDSFAFLEYDNQRYAIYERRNGGRSIFCFQRTAKSFYDLHEIIMESKKPITLFSNEIVINDVTYNHFGIKYPNKYS